jgi:hypothetical protein
LYKSNGEQRFSLEALKWFLGLVKGRDCLVPVTGLPLGMYAVDVVGGKKPALRLFWSALRGVSLKSQDGEGDWAFYYVSQKGVAKGISNAGVVWY